MALAAASCGALVVAVLLLPGPRAPEPQAVAPGEAGELRLVVSVPRGGARRAQSDGVADAVRLAVEERGGRVTSGNLEYRVAVDVLDTADADGSWSEAAERANVERATSDPAVIAYIGPATTAGARVVAPIAGRGGLIVIAPTLTAPGLTKRGYDDGLLEAVRPGGAKVIARVVPPDDVQATALASWLKETGRVPLAIGSDGSDVGDAGAAVLRQAARRAGVEVTEVADARAKFAYLTGASTSALADRAQALRRERTEIALGGSELLLASAFLERAKGAADGAVATFVGRPVDRYLGAAGDFFRAYRDRFGHPPDPYAIFGYEAARLALDAVRRAGGSRRNVRDAVFATKELRGALGTWGIDDAGDTTYAVTQLYLVRALPDGSFGWAWEREIRP